MTYYMKPPRGNIAFHVLNCCVQQRIQFLLSLENGEAIIPKNFEYLIEGSPMDRTGHFLLRLLSLSNYNLKMFILKAETHLFINRLNTLNYYQVINMLKTLYKHVQDVISILPHVTQEFTEFLSTVKHICRSIIKQDKSSHTFKEDHPDDCLYYNIRVPFKTCLPLVQKREVELKSGQCIIPCGKWKVLLQIIFTMHIEFGMKHLESSGCFKMALLDPRIQKLSEDMKKRFSTDTDTIEIKGSCIKANDVESESIYFPPCMNHLYKTLRSRHRLTHEARRQFTLFLKDIGMPIDEALIFWSREYSQPHLECNGGCTHSWQKDERRYRYSIRHMYGLEGGRYNYKAANCCTIQKKQLRALDEGGCPFQHFDEAQLLSSFSPELFEEKKSLDKILDLKRSGHSHAACLLYLQTQKKKMKNSMDGQMIYKNISKPLVENCDSRNNFLSPLGYFSILSEKNY